VDSPKRARGHIHLKDDSDQAEELPALIDAGDSVSSQVGAWDIISLLSPNLSPSERVVLDCLADGLGVREIGRRLNMSHTMVLRHRSKIASLLVKFEGHSFPGERTRKAIGNANRKKGNGARQADQARNAGAAKWSVDIEQRSQPNGGIQPRSMPAGTLPSWKCDRFLKPSGNLNRTANRSQAAA
jgi:hypothetical protein